MKQKNLVGQDFQSLYHKHYTNFSNYKTENKAYLEDWVRLFNNISGILGNDPCYIVDNSKPSLINKGIIIVVPFFPTMVHKVIHHPFEIHLTFDGNAIFLLPHNEDITDYPELADFKGNWKKSFVTFKKTIKKGWPYLSFNT